jgi:GT2 family glycosyltransferase
VQAAQTPFVLLLNPDCSIAPEAVQLLLDTAREYPQAGIIAPQSWTPSGQAQLTCQPAFYEQRPSAPYILADGVCSSKWLLGNCLLIRTDFYRAIGGFDENFFLYAEDEDLCLRMGRSGHECLLQPAAHAQHRGDGSSRPDWRIDVFKEYHYALSRQRIRAKYLGRGPAAVCQIKALAGALLAIPVYALLLRKRHLLKWLGWGLAMLSPAAFALYIWPPALAPSVLEPDPDVVRVSQPRRLDCLGVTEKIAPPPRQN